MKPALNEASLAQVRASDPNASTWLSANAGSGKTRVLTDRVARLLLDDVNPQKILCLTYTKAAAFEMQNRLFARLGEWAMLPDEALRAQLARLGRDARQSPAELARARTLFACAIETPGGLKIQTIHSFCASVLRRFPLEAQVSPDFMEIEGRAAELLRADIVDDMASGDTADLVAGIARIFTGAEFGKLLEEIAQRRDCFQRHFVREEVLEALDHDRNLTRDGLLRLAFDGTEPDFMPGVVETLNAGSTNDNKAAKPLLDAKWDQPDAALFAACCNAFMTKAGTVKKNFPTKPSVKILGPAIGRLHDLIHRIEAARDAKLALDLLDQTEILWRFSTAFLKRYESAKTLRGWLDFDDLIRKTRDLLSDNTRAQWVLYRLDGGIDHILVDEAQDTSPAQWDVIQSLATEITSGEGAHTDKPRTIFVVGDKKQSIYSFQGADPDAFDEMQAHFAAQLAESDTSLSTQTLDYSFRSSAAILGLVDATFRGRVSAGFGSDKGHIAFKEALPGRVDLWPLVEATTEKDDEPWHKPLDRKGASHHDVRLADHLADQIEAMLNEDAPTMIPDEDEGSRETFLRPVRPGDIMILVQSRTSGPFAPIIKALKTRNLPVAGADRLKVGAELAVQDILALLAFLDTPDDSLSLANALKSPLFGWSEKALFDLAHSRSAPQLWEALRQRSGEFPEAFSVIRDLRKLTDFLRPYDLIERILTRHSGRQKLIGRLGPEAEDGINALLSQALAYERTEVPSLTGFLSWAKAEALEIKRQVDSGGNLIRVMTVHGAKGLEAPIVILPNCATKKNEVRGNILQVGDIATWKPAGTEIPAASINAINDVKAAQERERLRLLYVAMTRAEKWLIVAASGKLENPNADWHTLTKTAMEAEGAMPLVCPTGMGLRLQHGDWETLPVRRPETLSTAKVELPDYLREAPTTQPERPKVLSPSGLGGAKALPSESGLDEEIAKARGSYLHRIVELLIAEPKEAWLEIIDTVSDEMLASAVQEGARTEALALLADPDLAWIFAPGGMSEVSISGTLNGEPIHGVVDRLILSESKVTVIDFKSNQAVPKDARTCPEGLLRQMGAYEQILSQIYPERQIETGLLWSATRNYMPLPHDLVKMALDRAGGLDDTGDPS